MFNFTVAVDSTSGFVICLLTSAVLGMLKSLVFMYKERHSASFALTLALLPMTVAVVIMLVNGNLGTGVAVAGAFALVRFRSVPGTAKEIAAIFTAMAIGLATGMGYLAVAVVFFLFVSVFCLVLTHIGFGHEDEMQRQVKILVPENYDYQGLFDDLFSEYAGRTKLERVKTTGMGTLYELTYLVTFKDSDVPKEFVDGIRSRNGNLTVSIGTVPTAESL